jgi:hypothetical protein
MLRFAVEGLARAAAGVADLVGTAGATLKRAFAAVVLRAAARVQFLAGARLALASAPSAQRPAFAASTLDRVVAAVVLRAARELELGARSWRAAIGAAPFALTAIAARRERAVGARVRGACIKREMCRAEIDAGQLAAPAQEGQHERDYDRFGEETRGQYDPSG